MLTQAGHGHGEVTRGHHTVSGMREDSPRMRRIKRMEFSKTMWQKQGGGGRSVKRKPPDIIRE